MKTKHEIELDWPDWARFWMGERHGNYAGFWKNDPRELVWTDTQAVVIIERPEPRFQAMPHGTGWSVSAKAQYEGTTACFYGDDAARHAKEFADKLSREVSGD